MAENQLKCPNCAQYKISSIQYRLDPKTKKRISITNGLMTRLGASTMFILGGIGFLLFLCVALFEPSLWWIAAAYAVIILLAYQINNRYNNYPTEFDHSCQLCGYQWTSSEIISREKNIAHNERQ